MSLHASHFPVVAPRAAINQDGGIKIQKNTNSNKAHCSVSTANYSQKVSKCRHSPSVFSHKIDGQRFSPAVSWPAADIITNGGWRCDECCNGVLCRCAGPEVGNSSFHMGHSTTYTVSTYITLMIIKDKTWEASSYAGQGAPMHFCITLLKSLVTSCFEGSRDSIFSRRFNIFTGRIVREFSLEALPFI